MDHKINKMLIDATHPEETRVVVLKNGRVEEFDFESAARVALRGNIYLAKVTRVEPSLQAAFVEYGGNRHGFLAFGEIHPDYYQIPMADRQALLDDELAAELEADQEADERAERMASRNRQRESGQRDSNQRNGRDGGGAGDAEAGDVPHGDAPHSHDGHHHDTSEHTADPAADHGADPARNHEATALPVDVDGHRHDTLADSTGLTSDAVRRAETDHLDEREPGDDHGEGRGHVEEIPGSADEPEIITNAGEDAEAADALEEMPERPRRQRRRPYKIQEVIKRRQIMLVQVVKEERGNKGAALTTYLSLAGRYTVLMPNTGRGGGISRKITSPQDRKRLKAIAQELDVPEGMGLIVRTAGASRTMAEIRRDYEYLMRLWESIRDVTLSSTAPSLIYEEGNLIKRSIRDLYTKDVDEIMVAGEVAHAEAQDFMRMLMPSHTKNVILHKGPEPLLSRYPIVERQLNQMFSPHVPLKSGGYLVINQTEALVAIDINSGKSTREFNIEDTALNTNLEAADEIARQLKLRDLAGLIVIDFIDMEEKRNNRAVERRMKDALRFDRARIQVGRISHFGLLEMSRQRMRTGVLEGSTTKCPHCEGTGIIRSVESVALAVLRGLEEHLQRDGRSSVNVLASAEVALYILNHKRNFVMEMERRFGVAIAVLASEKMQGANFTVERSAAPLQPRRLPERAAVTMNSGFNGQDPDEVFEDEDPRPATVADARGDESNIDVVDDPEDGDEDRPTDRREHQRGGGRSRDRDRSRGNSERGGGDRNASERGNGGRNNAERGGNAEQSSNGEPSSNGERSGNAERSASERDGAERPVTDRAGDTQDGRRRKRRRGRGRGRPDGGTADGVAPLQRQGVDPALADGEFDAAGTGSEFVDDDTRDHTDAQDGASPNGGRRAASALSGDDQPELTNGDGDDTERTAGDAGSDTDGPDGDGKRRRRRGRRGGRRGARDRATGSDDTAADVSADAGPEGRDEQQPLAAETQAPVSAQPSTDLHDEIDAPTAPARSETRRPARAAAKPASTTDDVAPAVAALDSVAEPLASVPPTVAVPVAVPPVSAPVPEPTVERAPPVTTEPELVSEAPSRPARRGWWKTRMLGQ